MKLITNYAEFHRGVCFFLSLMCTQTSLSVNTFESLEMEYSSIPEIVGDIYL